MIKYVNINQRPFYFDCKNYFIVPVWCFNILDQKSDGLSAWQPESRSITEAETLRLSLDLEIWKREQKKNNLKVEHNIKTRSGFLQSCSLSPTVAKWAKSEIISYRELHKTSAESKIRKYGFFTQPSDTTTEAIFEQLILFLSHFIFTKHLSFCLSSTQSDFFHN